MDKTVPARHALDRADWIREATDTLAEQGLSGLRVEVLSKRLGVTKGSFYWHFKDRSELLGGVLDHWKAGRIREAARLSETLGDDPGVRIRYVMDLHSLAPNRKGIAIELAIRDWARRDAAAAEVVEAVDQARLHHASGLFVAAGFGPQEARMRALLLYTHAFGLSLMHFHSGQEDIAALHEGITDLILRAGK